MRIFFLRYLLGDHPEMSPKAKEIILAGAQTTVEVLAEDVYVLKCVYKTERHEIVETIGNFLLEVRLKQELSFGRINLNTMFEMTNSTRQLF